MTAMSVDDLLIAIIIAGLGLSGAYLKAEYLSWRRYNAAQRKQQASLRAWHINRLRRAENDASMRDTSGSLRDAFTVPPMNKAQG
jgi:hypothetical protein